MKLDLERELPKAARLSFWPFLDLLALGLFFALFSSKFVVAPGITLALPQVTSSHVSIAPIYEVITVSEAKGQEMIFYKDSVLNLLSLQKVFDAQARPASNATLLVKADARVSMATLSALSDLAIQAGYAQVQLATDDSREAGSPFFERQ